MNSHPYFCMLLLHKQPVRSSEYAVESLLFLVEIVRYKYAMNGFKHIEKYSIAAATSFALRTKSSDELTWYMPLPPSLVDEVVKPPNVKLIKSVSIEINEDLATPPHARMASIQERENEEQKNIQMPVPSPLPTQTKRNRNRLGKGKNKKKPEKRESKTTKNPLFHWNTNIDMEARVDGTMNELDQWDEAQIAWGTLSHALMIYEKYIRVGCLLEINISHGFRRQLREQFDDLKKLYMDNHDAMISGKLEDIMSGTDRFNDNVRIFSKYPEKRKELEIIFDQTCRQIECLMNDSYLRFRQTPAYHRLLKQLIKNQMRNQKKETLFSKASPTLSATKDILSHNKS